jgi:hypothetical protein
LLQSTASLTAGKIGFVSQRTAPPVPTSSALVTFEGAHLVRHRFRHELDPADF